MFNRITILLQLSAFLSSLSLAQSHLNPAVALAPNGVCAVASNVTAADGGGVYVVLRDTAERSSAPVRMNAMLPGAGQHADVCVGAPGRFITVWEQWVSGTSSIYIASVREDGTMEGPPSSVVDNPRITAQTPRVASGADGRFVVVWLDYRNGRPCVYAQRYGRSGKKTGKNLCISDAAGLMQTPGVCVDAKNTIGFVWQETVRDSFRIVFRSASWNDRVGGRVLLDESHGTAYASTPDIASAIAGEFLVVWKDYRTGESDIYVQHVTGRGEQRGANRRINDDSTNFWQRLPRITASQSAFYVVWEDYRNDSTNQTGDIYAQPLEPSGRRSGVNRRVNASPEPTIQRFPAVAMNGSGDVAVAWSDTRSAGTSVFMRRGRVTGEWGAEARVAP